MNTTAPAVSSWWQPHATRKDYAAFYAEARQHEARMLTAKVSWPGGDAAERRRLPAGPVQQLQPVGPAPHQLLTCARAAFTATRKNGEKSCPRS